jgi:hypothetical protein
VEEGEEKDDGVDVTKVAGRWVSKLDQLKPNQILFECDGVDITKVAGRTVSKLDQLKTKPNIYLKVEL